MATAAETQARPAVSQTASIRQTGVQPARGSRAASKPPSPRPTRPPISPAAVMLWLRQLVLMFSMVAALVTMLAARAAGKPMLKVALYTGVAALATAMVGMLLANVLVMPSVESTVEPSDAPNERQG